MKTMTALVSLLTLAMAAMVSRLPALTRNRRTTLAI